MPGWEDHDKSWLDLGHGLHGARLGPADGRYRPPGTYRSNRPGSCLDAGPGHYVDLEGQSDQFSCPVGSFNPDNSSISLDSCILSYYGHFVSIRGQSEVEPCAIGSYQPNLGQEGCLDADPGNYVESPGMILQKPCPLGEYQPESGEDGCPKRFWQFCRFYRIGIPGSVWRGIINHIPDNHIEVSERDIVLTRQTSQTECLEGTFQPD